MSETKTFYVWIEGARELRGAAFLAEAKLLSYLEEFQASDTWQAAGFTSFARLLVVHKLASPERFADWRAGHDALGDTALSIGAPATVEAAQIKDADTRGVFVASCSERARQEGFPISAERAKQLRQQVDPVASLPGNLRRRSREAERIVELEAANATLRARVRELEAALAKATGVGKKRKAA